MSSPSGHQASSTIGLRIVGITRFHITSMLIFEIDQTCELIGLCQLSKSLYVQEGTKFHPAIVTALNDWFSKLKLPLDMMEMCLGSATIQEWKKVKRIDSDAGDLMCASSHCSGRDSRDSSYIRACFSSGYSLASSLTTIQYQVLGINEETVTHYGKLEHVITITLPQGHENLQSSEPVNSIVALVHRCILKEDDPQLASLDIHFFSKERQSFDIIDITSVQCLVGRVKRGTSWAIIDRSGKLAQARAQDGGEQEPA
jgi:hypothetical protein